MAAALPTRPRPTAARQESPPWTPEIEAELWSRVRGTRDAQARETLIHHFLPYARTVAATYYKRRTHDQVEFADYLQLAQLGLIEALDRYDPAAGAQFKTFAARRMHGSILDGLEKLTERQQQIAADRRIRDERMRSLRGRHGHDDGLPDGVGTDRPQAAENALEQLAGIGIGMMMGYLLEGTGMLEVAGGGTCHDNSPYQPLVLRQAERRVAELVHGLPEQERRVIRGHYLQKQSFDEIASNLGVTKGRVSQIHKKALGALRERLGAARRCDVNF